MNLVRKLRRDAERKDGLATGKFGRIESLEEHQQAAADLAAIRYRIEGGLSFAPAKAFAVEDLFTIPKAAAPRTGPTGPRTSEGKAKSCLNNLRHGLAGAFRVLDDESQSDFDALAKALRDEHLPTTATEAILVQRLAEHVWLSRRAQRLQDAAILANSPANLGLFLRYQTSNDRGFYKCLAELSRLRKERRAAPPCPAIEFESQNHQPVVPNVRVRPAEPAESPDNAEQVANLSPQGFELSDINRETFVRNDS